MDRGSTYYQKFLSGDDSAMADLIREYSDGLTLYLTSFVGNVSTAEELMLDTFAKLGVKKPRENGQYSFRTWLYAIGRNTALDYLRRRKDTVPLDEAPEAADETAELEERVIRGEQHAILHRALKTLSPEHYWALWLFYFEEMSAKETARILGRSTHAAEALLSRARKALKQALEKEGFTYDDL